MQPNWKGPTRDWEPRRACNECPAEGLEHGEDSPPTEEAQGRLVRYRVNARLVVETFHP